LPALTIDARRWTASGSPGRSRTPALAASGLLHATFALALVSLGVRAIAPRPEPDVLEMVFDPAPAAMETPPQSVPEPQSPAPAVEQEQPVPLPEPLAVPKPEAVPTPEVVPRTPEVMAPVVTPVPAQHVPRPAAPARTATLRPHPSEPSPSPRAEPAAPAPAPTPASIDSGWRGALNAWLAAHKRYPEAARMRGVEGVVGVSFIAEHDGRVLDVTITRSSGSPVLDNSVRDMLAGQRVPAFPASMPQSQASLSLAIRYALEQ